MRTEGKEVYMICDICGKNGAHRRHLSRTYGKGENLLTVENVPVISCPHCGESYLTIETIRELERLKRQGRKHAAKREVGVVSFA